MSHPCGTCALLPEDQGGVVDERFRVCGVRSLRDVDASIFPLIPCGNLQTCVYAVAERAADFIKQDGQFCLNTIYRTDPVLNDLTTHTTGRPYTQLFNLTAP